MSFEQFNVTTEDGYILALWHVWDPSVTPKLGKNGQKKVIFFQHGLIDVAGTWFFNTPDKSLAHDLASEGFDVWLGNNRGTTNSFQHVNLTYDDQEFWNFSFHEMGVYDLPANVHFVIEKTGVDKIDYVGHSQGTTQFWVANMMRNDIGHKIDTFIGMAPVMYLGHQTSIMATLGIELGWDLWLEEHMWSILWIKQGTSLLSDLVVKFSPALLTLVPRTTWSFVQGIVGFDDVSHMDTQQMPMMARNDVGGTST